MIAPNEIGPCSSGLTLEKLKQAKAILDAEYSKSDPSFYMVPNTPEAITFTKTVFNLNDSEFDQLVSEGKIILTDKPFPYL